MHTSKPFITTDIKALLSTLWIFVLLNIIFRDIHEFVKSGFLEEVMAGTVNGVEITEGLMVVGWMMAEIPISMVLFSRILKYQVNRWANIVTGTLTIAFVVSNGARDLDDVFFAVAEFVALALIVWHAWKWPKQEA